MVTPVTKTTYSPYKAEIFIGGDLNTAIQACMGFATVRGLCVTVTPTTYAFTGGVCEGVIVGLINYARFPEDHYMTIWNKAYDLAILLLDRLEQGSFTIQDPHRSYFYSIRPEDTGETT